MDGSPADNQSIEVNDIVLLVRSECAQVIQPSVLALV